jgi:hypothetical protein
VLDLSDLNNLHVRGAVESARWGGGYAIADGYAYVPSWVDGVRIIDVQDPDDPQEVVKLEIGVAMQAVVVGDRAYVANDEEGLAVLDVSDPRSPQILDKLYLGGFAESLAVAGERAYVTVVGSDSNALHVVDVTDPARLVELGQATLQGKGVKVAVDQNAGYAYVGTVECAYHQCSGGFQVVDIRDPLLPRAVVWVEAPGGVYDVALSGKLAFLAAGWGGVWALDLSHPQEPRAVGWQDTAGRARSVVLDGDRVYVADGAGGLLALGVER